VGWKARREETESTGRRKPEAEASGGGPDLGQSGAERRALKKLVGPAGLRAAATYVMTAYKTSKRHACRLVGLTRSTHRYRSRRAEKDAALRARLKVNDPGMALAGVRRSPHPLTCSESVSE
jgi:hypothetical protein